MHNNITTRSHTHGAQYSTHTHRSSTSTCFRKRELPKRGCRFPLQRGHAVTLEYYYNVDGLSEPGAGTLSDKYITSTTIREDNWDLFFLPVHQTIELYEIDYYHMCQHAHSNQAYAAARPTRPTTRVAPNNRGPADVAPQN